MNKFYLVENEKQTGPFSIEELDLKGIKKDTLVWAENMENWTPAEQIALLKDIIRPTPPPIPKQNKKEESEPQSLAMDVKVAYQNFTTAMLVGVLSIILSFASEFYDGNDKQSWKILIWSIGTEVAAWFYFRKYLQNFKDDKIIKKVTWIIALNIIVGVFVVIGKDMLSDPTSEDLQGIIGLVVLISFLILTIFSIRLGKALKKIKNDSVGLLKELGKALTYLTPISFLLMLIIKRDDGDSQGFNVFIDMLDAVPIVIMIMIFGRARKIAVQKPQDISKSKMS